MPHGGDNFGKRGFGAERFALFFGGCFGIEAGEAFFEGDAKRDDWVARRVFFDPFGDFGEVFVLLADVVFLAEVDKEDDGFGG